MASRRPLREERDPFRADLRPAPSMLEHASELVEEARRREDKRQVTRPLAIQSIWPDPAQPRRALPGPVRAVWDGSPAMLPAVFEVWRQLVEVERGSEFDLAGHVLAEGARPEVDDKAVGPLEAPLITLADLAADIRRNGLLNPITVTRTEKGYQIETGERRWLAHHLVYLVTQNDTWLYIPARIVESSNVWRQAGENSARADLNAISRARQFALLLMDLYRQQSPGVNGGLLPFEAIVPPGGCDRAFYAQVADSERFRIPRGKADEILSAMGLKGRASFSRYRALLQLPDEIWQLGDDLNWSDDRLYLLATMEPEQALERARQMRRRDETRRQERVVLNQNNSRDAVPEPSFLPVTVETSDFKRRTLRVARMMERLDRLTSTKRREGLEEIRAIRRWLDQAERTLRDDQI